MKNKVGPPVRRGDFLERQMETQELWHRAERGHVLMLAPRRAGKTSLLRHLEDTPQVGWRCVFLSVESLETEAHFVARLLTRLSEVDGAWIERLGVGLKKLLRGIGRTNAGPVEVDLAESLKEEWRDIGAAVLRVIRSVQGDTLILIDEFPIFIRNLLGHSGSPESKRRVKLFLDWFREVRNAHDGGESRIHFILTGSLGLDAVLRTMGLNGTVNDLDSFSLGPLSDELARELLERLADGEDLPLPAHVLKRMLERIDWRSPYHLQLIFCEVLTRVRFHGQSLNEELVDKAYQALLSADNQGRLSHWAERLEDPLQTPQERDFKRALLRAAARDPKGVSQGSIYQIRTKVAPALDPMPVLISLIHDGYLTLQDGRWRFASSLLRDWWQKWQIR